MTEQEGQYFAIVPIHGRFDIVESENMEEVREGVDKLLEQPRQVFPNYDFEEHITLIQGEKIVWEKKE